MTNNDITIYKLKWGSDHNPEKIRFFKPHHCNDVVTRFSEYVIEFDRNPKIFAAYVHLERLPDSIFPEGKWIMGWTKTSDERPTEEGFETESEARS